MSFRSYGQKIEQKLPFFILYVCVYMYKYCIFINEFIHEGIKAALMNVQLVINIHFHEKKHFKSVHKNIYAL